MRLSSPIFSVLLVAVACLFGGAQSPSQYQPIQYGPIPGDLANALAEMARASRVPIIAELAQPLPHITMTNGAKVSDVSLDQLLAQAPGYESKREGKTIHFYNKQLRVARFNSGVHASTIAGTPSSMPAPILASSNNWPGNTATKEQS